MNLNFNADLAAAYRSKSQKARVLTEDWVVNNMFCPRCGWDEVKNFENNRPVADFYCPHCEAQFELKSKNGGIAGRVNDGAYGTMIERITSDENPDFLFMGYSMHSFSVSDLLLVPKHFFVPSVIEKRRALAPTARRAGWIGCNILLNKIPYQGRISIISRGCAESKDAVVEKVGQAQKLRVDDVVKRGWLLDVLNCVNAIQSNEFELNEIYRFEYLLAEKHPNNKNIRPKIRQQLQVLRDKGIIRFLGNGKYAKCL